MREVPFLRVLSKEVYNKTEHNKMQSLTFYFVRLRGLCAYLDRTWLRFKKLEHRVRPMNMWYSSEVYNWYATHTTKKLKVDIHYKAVLRITPSPCTQIQNNVSTCNWYTRSIFRAVTYTLYLYFYLWCSTYHVTSMVLHAFTGCCWLFVTEPYSVLL